MAALSTAAPQPASRQSERPPRRGVVTAILIAAAVLTFFLAFASWINRQVLDTDEWTKTSSELLENQEIRNALSAYLVDELYSNVDVAGELRKNLPPEAQGLAGPAAGGLRDFAQRAARRALADPRVQASWEGLNRQAHEEFVKIIKNEGSDTVSTAGGEVTLDLAPLVQQVAQRVGLGKLAEKVPPDAGQLTVMRSDQLKFAQDLAKFIETLVIVLLILALGLYGLALYLGRGRRRETLRSIGFIFIIVGVALLVLRSIGGGVVVGALTTTAATEPPANAVWSIGTSLLSEIAGGLIINGIILLIAAWVAGPTRAAVTLREASSPYMRERPAIAYGVVGLIFLLMVAWGPTRAFREPIGILAVAALLVLGTEALRRQTAREFPDAALADGGLRGSWDRTRTSVSQRAASMRGGRGSEAPTAVVTPEERLERLAALRDRGVLSDEEFQQQKTEILGH